MARNRSTAFHTGDNNGLAYVRQSVFSLQASSSSAEGAYAGNNLVVKVVAAQQVNLLAMCTVNAGVTGVQAYNQLACLSCGNHSSNNLFQGHGCAVHNSTFRFAVFQQFRVNKGACVNNQVSLFQKLFTFYSN